MPRLNGWVKVGLVLLGLFAFMAFLSIQEQSVIRRQRAHSNERNCGKNLEELFLLAKAIHDSNGGKWPTSMPEIARTMVPFFHDPFVCPASDADSPETAEQVADPRFCSYIVLKLTDTPNRQPFITETTKWHGGKRWVLYTDGLVELANTDF